MIIFPAEIPSIFVTQDPLQIGAVGSPIPWVHVSNVAAVAGAQLIKGLFGHTLHRWRSLTDAGQVAAIKSFLIAVASLCLDVESDESNAVI